MPTTVAYLSVKNFGFEGLAFEGSSVNLGFVRFDIVEQSPCGG
jgi:hypothetical protein